MSIKPDRNTTTGDTLTSGKETIISGKEAIISDDESQSTLELGEVAKKKEINGPRGLEPTRYGDWESKGRCVDF